MPGDAEGTVVVEHVGLLGVEEGEKLTSGIGPEVLAGAGDVNGSRSNEGDQLVLVEAEGRFVVVVVLEPGVEPVGAGAVDEAHRFPESPLAEGCAPAARVVGDHHREALVARPRPEGGLAEPGMPDDRHPPGVHFPHLAQDIEDAAQAPGPGGDGSPPAFPGGGEHGVHSVAESIVEIRIDIAAAQGGEGVAPVGDGGDRPATGGDTPVLCGEGGVVAGAIGSQHVTGFQRDARVLLEGVVAAEVQPKEGRCLAGISGEVEEKPELGAPGMRKGNEVAPPHDHAVTRILDLLLQVEGEGEGLCGSGWAAVHFALQDGEGGGSHFLLPGVFAAGEGAAQGEGFGQLVVRNLAFVVVGLLSVAGEGGSEQEGSEDGRGSVERGHDFPEPYGEIPSGARPERRGSAAFLRPAINS